MLPPWVLALGRRLLRAVGVAAADELARYVEDEIEGPSTKPEPWTFRDVKHVQEQIKAGARAFPPKDSPAVVTAGAAMKPPASGIVEEHPAPAAEPSATRIDETSCHWCGTPLEGVCCANARCPGRKS